DGEADEGAAQPGGPAALPILDRHPDRALDRHDLGIELVAIRSGLEGLTNCEERNGQRRHFDTVEKVHDAEGKSGLAGLEVNADETKPEADEQGREASKRRVPEGRRDRDKGQHHERKIVPWAEGQGELDDEGGDEG